MTIADSMYKFISLSALLCSLVCIGCFGIADEPSNLNSASVQLSTKTSDLPAETGDINTVPIQPETNLDFPEDPFSRKLVQVEDFDLIGGWRVPAAGRQNDKSLAFTNGGLAVRFDGGKIRLYLTHHNHLGGPIQELIALSPPGAPDQPVDRWPLLREGTFLGDLYGPARKANGDAAPACTGVFWDRQKQRLITTGRKEYAVPMPNGPFLCTADITDPDHPQVEGAFGRSLGIAQHLGGGLCDIPDWFANDCLGGNSLGVGFGGYCSGQGSSHGPSLVACSHDLSPSTQGITLLSFGGLGTKDPSRRERRPPDYSDAQNVWSQDPIGGIGFWAADRVTAGPAWIDTPTKYGLCYWTIQGCGPLSYDRQTATFGETVKERLYVYDPADLKDVAQGKLQPYQAHGHFTDWKASVYGRVLGACWDQKSQTLFLLHRWMWGNPNEKLPVIAAYKVR